MATKAFTVLVCSFAIVGQIHAQEVTVVRETNPSVPEPATPSSQPARSKSEDAPARRVPARKKKSAALPGIEEMRAAGALAADRLQHPAPVNKTNPSPTPSAEVAQVQPVQPVPGEKPRKEKPVETRSAVESKSGTTKSPAVGPAGPVRPTIMESGKEETDTSHSAKGESGSGQARPLQL